MNISLETFDTANLYVLSFPNSDERPRLVNEELVLHLSDELVKENGYSILHVVNGYYHVKGRNNTFLKIAPVDTRNLVIDDDPTIKFAVFQSFDPHNLVHVALLNETEETT